MADIASTLAAWLSTTASNSPSGATTIGTGLDDNLREIQGVVVRGLSHKGADIASATTTDIGAIEGLMHDITGTTTITGLGTVRAGILKVLKFEGALTLTHNATSLILPGGADISTADGDVSIFISEGSGNWRCLNYVRASAVMFNVGSFTRDISTASGTQAVTGVGFKPKAVVFLGAISGTVSFTSGLDDGTNVGCIVQNQPAGVANFHADTTFSIAGVPAGGSGLSQASTAKITTLGSDGFTLTWTKAGSPTGTLTVIYMAFR
jgi:hypothetical protein